jgi:hypothetical protein
MKPNSYRRIFKEMIAITILITVLATIRPVLASELGGMNILLLVTAQVLILVIVLLYIFMPRSWSDSDKESSFYWFRVTYFNLSLKILMIYAAWLLIWFCCYFLTNGIARTNQDLAELINNEMQLSGTPLEVKAERAIAGKDKDIKAELCSNYFSCKLAAISISELILNDVPALWRLLERLEDPCNSGKPKSFSYLCNISNYQQVFVLLRIQRTASDEYLDVVVKRKDEAKNLNQILGF